MKPHLVLIGLSIFSILLSISPVLAQEAFGESPDAIADYPEPDVIQLSPNDTLINDRMYRRISGSTDFYDTPGGNIVSSMGDGFNFITVYNQIDGWIETRPGRWIQSGMLTDVTPSRFAGVLLSEDELPYTMAWVLVNTYPSVDPGGEPLEENPIYLRYSTVNIYDTVEVDGWEWYQIGADQWIRQTSVKGSPG